jgi:2-iminobutanoate/2-iminopropanoate deaminase
VREIVRSDVNEEWVHSGIVEAGDFAFINYIVHRIVINKEGFICIGN